MVRGAASAKTYVERHWTKQKYVKIGKMGIKRKEKHAAVNKIKEELEDGTLRDRWQQSVDETIHQLAGGETPHFFERGASGKKRQTNSSSPRAASSIF